MLATPHVDVTRAPATANPPGAVRSMALFVRWSLVHCAVAQRAQGATAMPRCRRVATRCHASPTLTAASRLRVFFAGGACGLPSMEYFVLWEARWVLMLPPASLDPSL